MLSFPPATEMFQFAGLPPPGLLIQPGADWTSPAGFPHSDIFGSASARDSPKLFAACHVLHRLLAPRHPPRALCSLTPSASDLAVKGGSGPYRNSSDNTAKSKILNFNFYRSRIQLVRCDPRRRVPGAETGSPSGPLVGGLEDEDTDQGPEGVKWRGGGRRGWWRRGDSNS
jgi:hypothetical protein